MYSSGNYSEAGGLTEKQNHGGEEGEVSKVEE